MIDPTVAYGRPDLHQGILEPGHRVGPRLKKSKVFGTGGHKSKSGYADLMLTPMVDMFTLLVVYLIQQFSSTGEILHMSKDLVMPTAKHGKDMDLLPVVAISGDSIIMEGAAVADISDLVSGSNRDPNWLIPGLEEKLRDLRERYLAIRQGAAPTETKGSDPTTSVNIQADKALPFRILKRVMYTCQQAGYGNIHFAVVQGGGAAGTSAEDLNKLLHGGGDSQ
ncbi:MAG: biopolymer transporter ExbD [Deltaproteobacteria bacterium]|nr:biopolymer transporter ExbD [Deltaproteobacteria bacterium]